MRAAVALGLVPAAVAGPPAPRILALQQITAATETGFVERVTASNATWVAVSEPAGRLVVAYGPGSGKQLDLFALDEHGRALTSTPVSIQLPKPASLAAYTNVVSGMATHPTLPLLYVLQDLVTYNQPPVGDPKTNPVFNDLDRLFVYRLDPTNVQLVAPARGEWLNYGQFHTAGLYGAPLGCDAGHRRLYLPTLRDPRITNDVRAAVGYLELDADGLPVMRDGQVVPAHLQPVLSAGAAVGFGWVPVSSNRVVFGANFGLYTWDLADRRAPLTGKYLTGPDWAAQIVGHPTLPIVYRSPTHTGRFTAVELVDGYPSLLPQELAIANCWRPQVMAQRQQIAVGNPGQILFINLDARGWLTTTVTTILIPDFIPNALGYSPKYDRLYVAGGKLW
jgi:hypothetical protein